MPEQMRWQWHYFGTGRKENIKEGPGDVYRRLDAGISTAMHVCSAFKQWLSYRMPGAFDGMVMEDGVYPLCGVMVASGTAAEKKQIFIFIITRRAGNEVSSLPALLWLPRCYSKTSDSALHTEVQRSVACNQH